MKRVAIMISGGGSNMVKLVESMTGDHPARPVLVLSNREDAGGLKRAAELGVKTAVVDHRPFKGDRPAFDAVLTEALEDVNPDVVCLAGFMRILSAGFTNYWQGQLLNIHPSLLPKYTGLNTHARAIEVGDKTAGCTVHQVTAVLDDGSILGQGVVPVEPDDTPETLAARVLEMEHQLYPAVLRHFVSGNTNPLYLPTG
ncbi:phosphoribosylglycinamide formyltransferase [bacterium]|nr:phosphoribosylglycinamide formyltransferase [bacterium]